MRSRDRISLTHLAPYFFILIWSSGFIFTKLGLFYAAPFSFLLARYTLVSLVMLCVCILWRAPWPKSLKLTGHIAVSGLLLHGLYLGGVFAAIHSGLPAGITAVIVGLQPILTSYFAILLLGETVKSRQWLGLALGFAGVILTLYDKLHSDWQGAEGTLYALLALCAISLAAPYQKRFCADMDLRSGAVVQYAVSGMLTLPLAWRLEGFAIEWTFEFALVLAYLCLVLSIGAVSLLFWLIRQHAAAKIGSLFYLVPPLTVCFAYLIFHETLGTISLMGMAMAAFGVFLVMRS